MESVQGFLYQSAQVQVKKLVQKKSFRHHLKKKKGEEEFLTFFLEYMNFHRKEWNCLSNETWS